MRWSSCLCLLLAACSNNSATTAPETGVATEQTAKNPDTLARVDTAVRVGSIVPGESIGKVRLGEEASSLAVLGRADSSDAAMGKAWLTWIGKKHEHNNIPVLNVYTTYKDNTMREKTVQQVRTTSSQFVTGNLVHVYSSFEEIEKQFSGLKKLAFYKEAGRKIFIYDAVPEGIAFEIADAGGQQICTGIIVHQKNKAVTEVYIMLHPDMKKL